MTGTGFDTVGLAVLAVRLVTGRVRIGWVDAGIVARWRRADPDARIDADGALVVTPDATRFDAVARAARDAGRIRGWRDEAFDVVVPSTDQVLFTLERAAFRAFGLKSRAAQLVARRPDGATWVARRSRRKAIDPGLLDTLVGGGVAAGETPHQTLLREAAEEAGLDDALARAARPVAVFDVLRRVPEGVQHEDVFVHDLTVPAGWMPRNGDGEVDEFLCLAPDELDARLRAGEFAFEAAASVRAALAGRGG